MKIFLLAGAIATLTAAGCAASNGGGHVVGNSMMSQGASKKLAKAEACGCGADHKDHKNCKHEGGDKAGKDGAVPVAEQVPAPAATEKLKSGIEGD